MEKLLELILEELRKVKADQVNIRESQIRMEDDVKYHIKRTDLLETNLSDFKDEMMLVQKVVTISKFVWGTIGVFSAVISLALMVDKFFR